MVEDLNNFLFEIFLLSNKMVTLAGIHKMLGRVANREEPDQSDLVLHSKQWGPFLSTGPTRMGGGI